MRETRTQVRRARPARSHLPMAAAVVGATFAVAAAVIVYLGNDVGRILSIMVGLAILVATVWFAANPFRWSSRRFGPLRTEVRAFIGQVKQLNEQVVEGATAEEIEGSKAEMHETVERIARVAGEPG